MEYWCSMVGCLNSTLNSGSSLHFFNFPKDFELCMSWIHNCGRSELIQELVFGGPQPLVGRVVCSNHFLPSSYVDSNCVAKGLKYNSVPIPYDGLPIKTESGDAVVVSRASLLTPLVTLEERDEGGDVFYVNESGASHFIKQELKDEPPTAKNGYKSRESSLSSDGLLPLLVMSQDDGYAENGPIVTAAGAITIGGGRSRNSDKPRSAKACQMAWKRANETPEQKQQRLRANALRNANRRAQETPEERQTRLASNRLRTAARRSRESVDVHIDRLAANRLRTATRRARESLDARIERLYKNAVRAALRRSMESEEESKERRRKNALRAAFRRSQESPEERAERRLKDKVRSALRRQKETHIQTKIRRYADAVRAAVRRNNETDDQREQRRLFDVLRAARKRSGETSEQRQKRLQGDRERAARRRAHHKPTGTTALLTPPIATHQTSATTLAPGTSSATPPTPPSSTATTSSNNNSNSSSSMSSGPPPITRPPPPHFEYPPPGGYGLAAIYHEANKAFQQDISVNSSVQMIPFVQGSFEVPGGEPGGGVPVPSTQPVYQQHPDPRAQLICCGTAGPAGPGLFGSLASMHAVSASNAPVAIGAFKNYSVPLQLPH